MGSQAAGGGASRNSRTTRRNSSRRSWWSQWPAPSKPTTRAWRKGAARPSSAGFARPALLAVEQERRAGDPRPQELDVAAAHVVGRPRAHVVVELPAIGAVLVLVDAVDGEVARLLGGEMRVLLLHAAEGVLDRGVAPGQPAGQAALLADPLVHALGDRLVRALGEHARRRARAPRWRPACATVSGIDPGVAERDVAAERVGDDRDRRQPLLVDELGEVVDVAGHRVAAVGRPLAVAVAAQVGRDDVPVVPQRRRRPVPVPAVVAPAVEQEQRRLVRIAPVHVVQPEALGEVRVRGRGPACCRSWLRTIADVPIEGNRGAPVRPGEGAEEDHREAEHGLEQEDVRSDSPI